MKDFVQVNNSLVNTSRLLALQHKPNQSEGSFRSAEHYLAIFDTGKELWLSPEDGAALMVQYQDLVSKPPDGMIATTSEMAI
jgi:hypothetical protein